MAETTIENQVCRACGADVREGSLFCYSCGRALSAEIAVARKDKSEPVINTEFKENVFAENENGAKQKKINQKIQKPVVEETFVAPVEKSNTKQETKLKSAAAMREQSKNVQPKRVEIIWEEHENTPNVWFIAVTIFLTILAGVVLFLAMRLK